jgi:transcriptional/translational regulatory protein YebC/TACO1
MRAGAVSEVGQALKKAGYAVEKAEVEMKPKNSVAITRKDEAVKLLNMIDRFEENDDVENVYANFDIADEILQELD